MELFIWVHAPDHCDITTFGITVGYEASAATSTGIGTQTLFVDPVFAFAAEPKIATPCRVIKRFVFLVGLAGLLINRKRPTTAKAPQQVILILLRLLSRIDSSSGACASRH